MIKAKYDGRTVCEIHVNARKGEVPAEIIGLMHELWQSVDSKDHEMGEQIKTFLTHHVEVLFMSDEELAEWVKKEIPDDDKLRALKALQEINDLLDDILKSIGSSDDDEDEDDED